MRRFRLTLGNPFKSVNARRRIAKLRTWGTILLTSSVWIGLAGYQWWNRNGGAYSYHRSQVEPVVLIIGAMVMFFVGLGLHGTADAVRRNAEALRYVRERAEEEARELSPSEAIDRANEVVKESRKCPACIKETEYKLSFMTSAEKAAWTDPTLGFCPSHRAKYEPLLKNRGLQ